MDRLWTPDLVEVRLAEAFATIRTGGGLNKGGVLLDLKSKRRLSGADLIVTTLRLLGAERHEPERSALLVWAKNQAKVSELTIPQFCARRGALSRQGFDKMRRRGSTIVSDGLNAVIMLLEPPEIRDTAA